MKTCPICQATYPDAVGFCPRDGSELVSTGTWSPGTLVRGRYRILDKIGEGGMGAVYKAKHTGFDEFRAIKVLNWELSRDEKFLERFKREAYVTRKLNHPNAVKMEDIDEAEDGSPFIVMEFIEGRNLKDVIEGEGPLSAPRVCAIARQVAAALDAAHTLGMIHRDIKPENIVLVQGSEGEKAKVLDFGIASVREVERGEEGSRKDLTGGGFVVGTPAYISPEQAQGRRGNDLDGRSDLYSLGIVMYQSLTGDLPFKSQSTMEMLMAHIQTPPNPIRMVRPDLQIPEPLAVLVMRMLQKDRNLRPPSAAALIEELSRIEKTIPIPRAGPRGTVMTPSAPGPIPPPPRPASYVPQTPRSIEPSVVRQQVPDVHTPFYKRPMTILIAVLIIGAGVWYQLTHRPTEEIAQHQAAAADLERRQLLPQAEEEYRAALQLDPNNEEAQSALGHVLVEERKWDDAISTLRVAVASRPDDVVALNNLGVALETVGNVNEAIPEFQEAIHLQPDYLEAHSNLGQAFEKQGDFKGSAAEFHEVLRLKPDDAEAHFHLGLAAYKQGDADGAVNEYREAIRIQPGFALAHFSLGGVLYDRGEHDEGIAELRTAYSLSPDDPEIRAAYQKLLEK